MDDGEAEDAEDAEEVLAHFRTVLEHARYQRRARAATYERRANQQRVERVARGLPADEEDCASESVSSDDASDSD